MARRRGHAVHANLPCRGQRAFRRESGHVALAPVAITCGPSSGPAPPQRPGWQRAGCLADEQRHPPHPHRRYPHGNYCDEQFAMPELTPWSYVSAATLTFPITMRAGNGARLKSRHTPNWCLLPQPLARIATVEGATPSAGKASPHKRSRAHGRWFQSMSWYRHAPSCSTLPVQSKCCAGRFEQEHLRFDVRYVGPSAAGGKLDRPGTCRHRPCLRRCPDNALVVVSGSVVLRNSRDLDGRPTRRARICRWLAMSRWASIRLVSICSGALLVTRAGLT